MTLPYHDPFDEMQKAVDIVNSSAHPTNKIAATLCGADRHGGPYSIAMINYWPERIHARFGDDMRFGNSSGTIHAETACILTAPRTEGASLFVTDPFCPNCAKNIAEAGIRTIYIDHKGFTKDFASRRREAFDMMSMRICQKAGVKVFELHRKDRQLKTILDIPDGFIPAEERPVRLEAVEQGLERQSLAVALQGETAAGNRRFAAAVAHDDAGKGALLLAQAHAAIGFTYGADMQELERTDGKYSFLLEPVNRLLMNAARQGLKLSDGLVYSGQVPTSREQINLVGAGIAHIMIGDMTKARDAESLQALSILSEAKILIQVPPL